MATRLIGTDDADPRLPALVVAATQGATSADFAPGDILGTTTTWTPTWTGLTVGNGTVTARRARLGPFAVNTIRVVFGTGTSITGNVIVSTSDTNVTSGPLLSTVRLFDSSATSNYPGLCAYFTATSVYVLCYNASATYAATNPVTASVPFTWATGDEMIIAVGYLAV